MRDVDLHVGQFGQHAMVELVAPEQIDGAGLLAHVIGHRRERDLAREIDAAVDQRLDAADERAKAGLHVHHAMAVQPAVLDGAIERIALPAFADRLGVEVPGEQQVRAALAAVHFPQGVEAALVGLLTPDLADAEGLEPCLELAGERVFLAVRAVDPHHFLSCAHRSVGRQG